jgi:hypothetical protein
MKRRPKLRKTITTALLASCSFGAAFLLLDERQAQAQTPMWWSIDDPNTTETWDADISAEGTAVWHGYNYILRVVNNNNGSIMQSVSGTSVGTGWTNTVPEPQNGWSNKKYPHPGIEATLELRHNGFIQDTQIIYVR